MLGWLFPEEFVRSALIVLIVVCGGYFSIMSLAVSIIHLFRRPEGQSMATTIINILWRPVVGFIQGVVLGFVIWVIIFAAGSDPMRE